MTDAPTTRETADHAELARLAEAAARQWPSSGMITWFTRDGGHLDDMEVEDREFIAAMSPAVCSALLSEIAALRGALTWVDQVQPSNLPWSGAQVEITWDEFNAMRSALGLKEAKPGKPNGRSYNWKKRATQAERQRDELRKAADTAANLFKLCTEPTMFENVSTLNLFAQMAEWLVRHRSLLANQGADKL